MIEQDGKNFALKNLCKSVSLFPKSCQTCFAKIASLNFWSSRNLKLPLDLGGTTYPILSNLTLVCFSKAQYSQNSNLQVPSVLIASLRPTTCSAAREWLSNIRQGVFYHIFVMYRNQWEFRTCIRTSALLKWRKFGLHKAEKCGKSISNSKRIGIGRETFLYFLF